MIVIDDLDVYPDFGTGINHISWIIRPTTEIIGNYQIEVQRALAPGNTFTTIGIGSSSTLTMPDTDVFLYDRFRKYYYKLKVTSKVTSDVITTDSVYSSYEYTPTIVEILRKEELLLRQYLKRPAKFLIRKTEGQYCTCWDATKNRSLTSSCSSCFKTGFLGGYYTPIAGYIGEMPKPEQLRILLGIEMNSTQNVLWTINYPALSPADIIVDTNANTRYRVVRVEPTNLQGYKIKQTVITELIQLGDIVYTVPLT